MGDQHYCSQDRKENVTKEDVDKAFAEYEKADIKFLAEAAANRPVGWVDAMVAFSKYWKLKKEFENGN